MELRVSAAHAARQARGTADVASQAAGVQRRTAISLAAALALGAVCVASTGAAAEPGFSAWVRNPHAQARLIALGPAPGGGERQAAVEIRLDPGYLTYWRQPGEAGLPPTFDTAASTNVSAVAVDYPAPGVFAEAGVPLFGYRGSVVFPLRVTLAEPGRPATLAVQLSYAVCAAICLPGSADLSLDLPDATAPDAQALVADARAAVPRRTGLGAAGTPAIEAVTPSRAGGDPGLTVTARASLPASLFVEGPEGWFFVPGAATERAPGTVTFPVAVTDRPAGATGPVDLRFTLVDASGAIEVPVRLPAAMDAAAATP